MDSILNTTKKKKEKKRKKGPTTHLGPEDIYMFSPCLIQKTLTTCVCKQTVCYTELSAGERQP
jgi:hypothetical protein